MIIATAGHVDHGKTSLVWQLTGVKTDRLEEEKRRGLSINLGYAYLPRSQGTPLGFIDVPGHQRFINTMISGVSGIDMGMLVVAADDGPMPQTLEHLDVLELLGVEQLTLVISKIDRVDGERLAQVQTQLDGILAARSWSDVAFFCVSNKSGNGVAALKSHLLENAEQAAAHTGKGYFRLSIDRAFTTKGAGLVVTGTASSGAVHVGDLLKVLPGDMDVRVKGIRAHDETVESARAGQRVALNIAGKLQAASIARGDWLVEPEAARSTKRLDVEFTLLPNAPFPLKHLAPVKLYIGAKRIAGRLALLDTGERHDSAERGSNRLLPGTGCLAQLILDGDIACVRGERFLLRDHAENVILGGGIILDPAAPQSGKSRPARIAWLKGMQAPSPAAALAELVAQDQLIELQRFRHTWNLREDEAVEPLPVDSRHFSAEGRQWLVSTRRWRNAEQLLLGLIAQWHREQPQLRGIKMTELHRSMAQHCESALTMAVLIAHLETGDLVLHEGHIRRAEFQATESAEAIVNWNQVQQCLEQCGRNIPLLSELCARCALSETDLNAVVKTATKSGKLIRINAARYAQPEQLMVFARDVISCDSNSDMLSIANLKSRFGSGRKLTVEIMEYFDSVHFTRRQGEARVILHAEVPGKLFQT